MGVTEGDRALLLRALELARRGRRTSAPNPNVGCVIARDGTIHGAGYTQPPGGPHAEAVALAEAATDAAGATAYVTLEPCSHHGRTPPCADALVAAGITRVVVATGDPAPWVAGAGLERLRASGVVVDLLADDDPLAVAVRKENAAFRTSVVLGRPHVTYKAAVSLDGRTAVSSGDARWISSSTSRALVHEWRAQTDAVLVGSGTALADDATLTARDVDPPAARQPLRVVADRRARLPLGSRLLATPAEGPVLVLVGPDTPAATRTALERAGAETAVADTPPEIVALLHARGVQSLLLEGGATLAAAFLAAGLIDRVALFIAPLIVGDPSAPSLFGPGAAPATVAAALALAALECRPSGPDILLEAWIHVPA